MAPRSRDRSDSEDYLLHLIGSSDVVIEKEEPILCSNDRINDSCQCEPGYIREVERNHCI